MNDYFPTWICGCGWTNGVNLYKCARCNRPPDEYCVQGEFEKLRDIELRLRTWIQKVANSEIGMFGIEQKAKNLLDTLKT